MAQADHRAGDDKSSWRGPARTDLGAGVGLRTVHFVHVLENWPAVGFFEVLSDNFLDTGGRPMRVLDEVAERYPIYLHGVAMNLGSVDPLDLGYLRRLRALRERCGARLVSDHLCWTGVDGVQLHDLLPLPYTEEALRHVVGRIRMAQDVLEMPLVIENPSTYIEFAGDRMREWEFLSAMAAEADCGLLLDVNNVYVSCQNHGWNAMEYLRGIDWERVIYFHLAGHSVQDTHLLDTHDHPVCDAVWELYAEAHRRSGGRSTLIEWDQQIPSFAEVWDQAERALAVRAKAGALRA